MKKPMKHFLTGTFIFTLACTSVQMNNGFSGEVKAAENNGIYLQETTYPTVSATPPVSQQPSDMPVTAQPPVTVQPPVTTGIPVTEQPTASPPQQTKYPIGWACFYGSAVYDVRIPGDLSYSCAIETLGTPDIYVDGVKLTYKEEYTFVKYPDALILKQSFLKGLNPGPHSVRLVFFNNIKDVSVFGDLYVVSDIPSGTNPSAKTGSETESFSTTGGVFVKDFDNGLSFPLKKNLDVTEIRLNNHKLKSADYSLGSDMLTLSSKYLNSLRQGTYYLRVKSMDQEEILTVMILPEASLILPTSMPIPIV